MASASEKGPIFSLKFLRNSIKFSFGSGWFWQKIELLTQANQLSLTKSFAFFKVYFVGLQTLQVLYFVRLP